jgi:hypothetical protein
MPKVLHDLETVRKHLLSHHAVALTALHNSDGKR